MVLSSLSHKTVQRLLLYIHIEMYVPFTMLLKRHTVFSACDSAQSFLGIPGIFADFWLTYSHFHCSAKKKRCLFITLASTDATFIVLDSLAQRTEQCNVQTKLTTHTHIRIQNSCAVFFYPNIGIALNS